eukprot:269214-Rhodomonas_salina.1
MLDSYSHARAEPQKRSRTKSVRTPHTAQHTTTCRDPVTLGGYTASLPLGYRRNLLLGAVTQRPRGRNGSSLFAERKVRLLCHEFPVRPGATATDSA